MMAVMIEQMKSQSAEFPPELKEKWSEGANAYKRFAMASHVDAYGLLAQDMGALKALFMKEKPAIFGLTAQEHLLPEILQSGLSCAGQYVYDKEQVQEVIDNNRDLFLSYGSVDADEVMKKLSQEDNKFASTVRGVVLGYPLHSAMMFERVSYHRIDSVLQRLGGLLEGNQVGKKVFDDFYGNRDENRCDAAIEFFMKEIENNADALHVEIDDLPDLRLQLEETFNARGVNVNGVFWKEFGDDEESRIKEKRLAEAFKVFHAQH